MILQEKTLGEKIADELEARKWTQRHFAVLVGCDETLVSRWVNDAVVPSLKYRRKLKTIFQWK